MKIVCLECGEIDHMLINGYSFADRILEDVMFDIATVDGKIVAEVVPEDAEWFDNFNKEKWLAAAVEYAENTDIGECPNCGGDCSIEDDNE